jgi:hypothetical protein
MDVTTQMIQFPQFGSIKRGANAQRTHRAIGAYLLMWLTCRQRNLHAPPQGENGCCTVGIADSSIVFYRISSSLLDRDQ